jgi:hypothetical protein
MEWRKQKLYLRALAEELEFAAFAYDELVASLFHPDEVMRRAQAFLSHAARASRLLWPQPGHGPSARKRLERGRMLRDLLGIPDTHPLAIRRLRNDWEHFDERLDERIDSFDLNEMIWQVVGGPLADDEIMRVVRHYDNESKVLTIFGTSEDLKALRAAVDDVGIAVYALVNKAWLQGGGEPENALGPFPHRRIVSSDA